MRLALNSDLWCKIYYTLGSEALDSRFDRRQVAAYFRDTHKIIINTAPDGNWESVDIPDDTLVMIMLKVGGNKNDTIR